MFLSQLICHAWWSQWRALLSQSQMTKAACPACSSCFPCQLPAPRSPDTSCPVCLFCSQQLSTSGQREPRTKEGALLFPAGGSKTMVTGRQRRLSLGTGKTSPVQNCRHIPPSHHGHAVSLSITTHHLHTDGTDTSFPKQDLPAVEYCTSQRIW